jgi:hypothetical protein
MLRILLKCSGQEKWRGGFCYVYIGIGCVGIRQTAGNIRVRRSEYGNVFKQWRARRRYREPIMFANVYFGVARILLVFSPKS